MKQLINKHDKNVRLVGVVDAVEAANYIQFKMPLDAELMVCTWSRKDWLLADMEEKKEVPHESEEFRAWLRERLKKKGYTASGVSEACGLSKGWLSNILEGRRRLKDKQTALLERELGLKPGAVARKRKECLQ